VYGVVAYRVRLREREIGIRLALGARPREVARRVIAQGTRHAIAGITIGVPAALLLSRVMASLLFGVTVTDLVTFTTLPVLIVAVTTLACYVPAQRAARVDPVTTIRQD
jgi:putative ABC transport system permease protein